MLGCQTPPGPGRHPPRDQADTPRGQADTHPPWDQADTPPREADSSIRSTSGRYASYWNAFLLPVLIYSKSKRTRVEKVYLHLKPLCVKCWTYFCKFVQSVFGDRILHQQQYRLLRLAPTFCQIHRQIFETWGSQFRTRNSVNRVTTIGRIGLVTKTSQSGLNHNCWTILWKNNLAFEPKI